MMRALGVFVVLAMVATPATAEKAAKKKPAKAPPPVEEPVAEQPAEDPPPSLEEIEASLPPHLKGPKLVDLGHEIEIDLPDGMILLERAEARKLLEKGGDSGENALAIVGKLDANWMIVIEYDDVGYVNDSDADQLDAKELFASYEQGTKQQNVRRKSLGVPELILDGWSEMPAYKRDLRRLVWGLKAHTTEGPVINFFTRILGRNGYISLNLIDSPDAIEQAKLDSAALLQAVRYRVGYRYEDHQDGDRDSGLGLKALVLGGAGIGVAKAAKAGILVKLLLVFKKGFILIIVAIAGLLKWLLGRKKSDDQSPSIDPPAPSDPPNVG
jgi:uncharacterized membrane-anchored protein